MNEETGAFLPGKSSVVIIQPCAHRCRRFNPRDMISGAKKTRVRHDFEQAFQPSILGHFIVKCPGALTFRVGLCHAERYVPVELRDRFK